MRPGEPAVNFNHLAQLNSTHPSSLHRPSPCTPHTDTHLKQVLSPVSRPPRSGISRLSPVPSLRRYIGIFDVSVGGRVQLCTRLPYLACLSRLPALVASSLQQDFPPASPLGAWVFFLCFFELIPEFRDIFRHLPLRDLPLFGSPVVTPRFRGGAAVPPACAPLPRRCLAFCLAFTAAPSFFTSI